MVDAGINPEIVSIVEELKQEILEFEPEAKFRLTAGSEAQFLDFTVYTPSGQMQLPANIMGRLDDIYRTHRVYVIAVMYPLTLYTEQDEGD
jgi:hypothetical protein